MRLPFLVVFQPWAAAHFLEQRGDGDGASVATAIWSISPSTRASASCVAPPAAAARTVPARGLRTTHDDVEQRQPPRVADEAVAAADAAHRRDDARAPAPTAPWPGGAPLAIILLGDLAGRDVLLRPRSGETSTPAPAGCSSAASSARPPRRVSSLRPVRRSPSPAAADGRRACPGCGRRTGSASCCWRSSCAAYSRPRGGSAAPAPRAAAAHAALARAGMTSMANSQPQGGAPNSQSRTSPITKPHTRAVASATRKWRSPWPLMP